MMFREYDYKKDRKAVHRIWKEIGWLEENEETLDILIDASCARIAEINGEAECLVLTTPGTIRYLHEDLPFSCVDGVGTSRIARKQRFAGKLTALSIAHSASEGALVTGLGMFEQGFYNRLGFGTGSYEHWITFDPASLKVNSEPSMPSRITMNDWEKVHRSRVQRKQHHGSCNLHAPKITEAEMKWPKKSFGFGYFDKKGEITHHVWFRAKKMEHGPYWVKWIAYQTREQFLELMALIKNLGDQVRAVAMREPADMQIQDLIDKPFKKRQITEKSEYENKMHASAYWQMRILDLEGCMEKTHLPEEVSFNLNLIDPIETMLDEDAPWYGIAGEYVVTLGPESHAERGKKRGLSTLKASVGAFSRMWLGIRPATGLAVTDDLIGPDQLLKKLDQTLQIPTPHPDWDF